MSFGSGGFGGFGQNNTNNNTSSGFGGFGNNSTTSGFGSTTTPNAFGANNNTSTPGGGLFGNPGGGSGFGATSGFGSNNAFGAKPSGFGTTTTTSGGSLFGSTTATAGGSGFGGSGFGSTSTSSPFGGGGTGSSLFGGGSKPGGFGSTTTPTPASSGMFGGNTGSSFGNTSSSFGATANPGLGTNVGDPPGTAVVAFSPTVEKEANNTQSSSYQNILFMDPYRKWSSEELRLMDYNQGRRFGNPGGTGAFGGSSFGAGSFGNNNQTAGFGTNNPTAGAFGGSQQPSGFGAGTTTNTTSAFGSGGSAFGGAKPAGGLFGSSQPATTGGGLFGQNNPGTGAFGSTGTANTFGGQNATGGGLFGNNSNAAKPSGFGGFGSTSNTTSGFGAPAAGTTNAFGGSTSTGGGLFGNTAQNNTTTNGFGSTATQQPASTSGFGGGTGFGAQNQSTGGGLFGNTQQKPGGLFGSAPTAATGGGGLFGNTGSNSTAFGGAATNQSTNTGGGLFGQKPATTGGGLFGQSTTNQPGATTGGGLFGGMGGNNQQQQPAQGGGLFGGLGQSQPKPSVFGGSQQSAGGGLFGQSNPQAGGLFGGSQQQQPQASGLGSSLFNNSQNTQSINNGLSTSLIDPSAYGSHTLFSMSDNKAQDPGPLATPLSGTAKTKGRSILPMYKLSPANASRFVTPQKRGFGFSYSTYGTPASPSSVASTPGGLGQSLLMGSINRGLSKSISTSNLRRSLNVEDSILQPGAFSSSSVPRLLGSASSQKKLIISREMRSDLFAPPTPRKDGQVQDVAGPRKLTKRVSFDTHPNGNGLQGSPVQTPDARSTQAEELGYLRPVSDSPNAVNGTRSSPAVPEMEQVKGNELAVVHEEEHVAPPVIETTEPTGDKTPGAYWMSPSRDEIVAMNRVQRGKVADFTVGRENIGSVRFKVPVDLSNIDVDDLFGTIVILEPRSATVYPIAAKKPPVGKGLNVPAIISLEQSWPRGRDKKTTLKDRSGPRLQKHIERLKAIRNTSFLDYDADKGIWTFSVEHFTTYGLDDEEDETDGELTQTSQVAPQSTGQYETASPDIASPETDPDDTFDFKRYRRAVPGAFDQMAMSDDEDAVDALPSQRAASVSSEEPEPNYTTEGAGDDDTMEVEEAFQQAVIQQSSPHLEEEQGEFGMSQAIENDSQVPAGIMRARMRAVKKSLAPTRIEVAGGNDWTQILQESVRAPRTVERAALRALNETGAAWEVAERGNPTPQNRQVSDGAGFATSIDLMKSLFDQSKGPGQSIQAPPSTKSFFKWPYQRRNKIDEHDEDVPASRPEWGPNGTLVTATEEGLALLPAYGHTAGTDTDKLSRLQQYIDGTQVNINGGLPQGPSLRQLAQGDTLWELATILFEDGGANLSAFWEQLVMESTTRCIASTSDFEEKTIACLSGNRVLDACENLLAGGNFRLATLVSTIGTQTKDLRAQLNDWKDSNVLSEFSEPIRAIYELLGGNACTCAGVKGVSIENRVSSFVISQRFNLDWKQSFALRLFYTSGISNVAEAVRSFQADIEQDREPEPDSPLWFLLKIFASGKFDWSSNNLDWLLTKTIFSTHKLDFGLDAAERLDQISVAFASALASGKHWVPAAFILVHLSDPAAREAAVRDHLGRHAHLISSPKKMGSPFTAMLNFGVPETWLWEARALHFRSRQNSRQEFLALMWAKNFPEANRTFLDRLAPELVIRRDYKQLYSFAELLFKIKDRLPDWDTGAVAYLVYPMVRTQDKHQPLDRWDERLFNGLVALRAATHGDICQEAAIADMAEDLLRCRGSDHRLLQLLPEDVRTRHLRNRTLVV